MIYKLPELDNILNIFKNEEVFRENLEKMDYYQTWASLNYISRGIVKNEDLILIEAGFSWLQNGCMYETDSNTLITIPTTSNLYFLYALQKGEGFQFDTSIPIYSYTQQAYYWNNNRALGYIYRTSVDTPYTFGVLTDNVIKNEWLPEQVLSLLRSNT